MVRIHPNRRGLNEALKSAEARRATAELAERVAENARSSAPDVEGIPGDIALPVTVQTYDTDRARATVWLAHPAGLAVQAKHGTLTKAASAAGLEVKGKR